MVGLPRLPFFSGAGFSRPTSFGGPSPNQVEDFCKKGAKIEVLAPSNRWREAQVVRIGGGVAKVHYTGYDAQFDEEVVTRRCVTMTNQRINSTIEMAIFIGL